MTVIAYSLVAQGDNIIADYIAPGASEDTGSCYSVNLDAVARSHVSSISRSESSGCAAILGYYFFHLIKDTILYLCVTYSEQDVDIARRFLNELETNISRHVLNSTSQRGELVTRILNKLVNEYNITNEKLKTIESSLLTTTSVLKGNIANILERGELIDSIVSKSTNLKHESLAFRKLAKSGIANEALWNLLLSKRWLIASTTLGVLVVFLILSVW